MGNDCERLYFTEKFGFYFIFAILVILVISIYSVSCVRGLEMGSKLYAARLFMNVGLLLMMFLAFISPIIVSEQTNVIRQLTMSSTLQDLLILIILSDTLQHDIWINRDTVLLMKVGGESKADEK